MGGEKIEIVDQTNNPYVFLPRNLQSTHSLSWKGLIAYAGLALHGGASQVKKAGISVKTMAQTSNISEKTFRAGLKELADKGLTGDFYVDIATGE